MIRRKYFLKREKKAVEEKESDDDKEEGPEAERKPSHAIDKKKERFHLS
jgi:hypothetical protein